MENSKKHNCYQCKFRGTVTGSAHSSCKVINEDVQFQVALLMTTHTPIIKLPDGTEEPVIVLDEHGKAKGWAMWPVNFDPVWVKKCLFYSPKEEETS